MTQILVTGAAGFIGSHVCDRLLAEGHRVVAVDDLSTGRRENLAHAERHGAAFTFHEADIRADGLACLFERERPEVVMHLAAQSGVRPSLLDPVHDASVNVLGLLTVLEQAVRARTRKVVFASSGGTIYGEPKRLPVRESAAASSHPLSPYGISKKAALDYLRYYRRARGLDFTALALGNVYGPRQDPLGEAGVVAIFASRMLGCEAPAIFGDGGQTRDYVFVDDVVRAFVLAMDRGSGLLVNIGTGRETSVNDLYRLLADITGSDRQPTRGPLPPGELRRIALDARLAGEALRWRPRTRLDEGLVETVAHLAGVVPERSPAFVRE